MLGHHWVPGEGRLVDIRYSGHPGNASVDGQTPHFLMDVQPQDGEPYRTEVELLPLMFTFRSPGFGQVVQLECDTEHKTARFVRDDPAINTKYGQQAAKAAYGAAAQAPPVAYGAAATSQPATPLAASPTTPRELAEAYLSALGRADLTAVLALFSAGATVHSPLYGPAPVSEFFPRLFGDTAQSRLTLRGVTHGPAVDGTPLVSIWFRFDWELAGGRRAPFDVVDVLELNAGLVTALHIVYDTADVRPAFEQDTGKPSWRGSQPGGG